MSAPLLPGDSASALFTQKFPDVHSHLGLGDLPVKETAISRWVVNEKGRWNTPAPAFVDSGVEFGLIGLIQPKDGHF